MGGFVLGISGVLARLQATEASVDHKRQKSSHVFRVGRREEMLAEARY